MSYRTNTLTGRPSGNRFDPCACGGEKLARARKCRECYRAERVIGELSLQPTQVPTACDVAWAAGIYEGEGSVSTNGHSLSVTVPQKDPELLHRLRAFFGGSVTYQTRGPRDLPDGRRLERDTYIHIWSVHAARADVFVDGIWPYLTERRRAQFQRAGARASL